MWDKGSLNEIVGSSPTMTGGDVALQWQECYELVMLRSFNDPADCYCRTCSYVIPCFAHRVIPALDAGISSYNRLSGQARQ